MCKQGHLITATACFCLRDPRVLLGSQESHRVPIAALQTLLSAGRTTRLHNARCHRYAVIGWRSRGRGSHTVAYTLEVSCAPSEFPQIALLVFFCFFCTAVSVSVSVYRGCLLCNRGSFPSLWGCSVASRKLAQLVLSRASLSLYSTALCSHPLANDEISCGLRELVIEGTVAQHQFDNWWAILLFSTVLIFKIVSLFGLWVSLCYEKCTLFAAGTNTLTPLLIARSHPSVLWLFTRTLMRHVLSILISWRAVKSWPPFEWATHRMPLNAALKGKQAVDY